MKIAFTICSNNYLAQAKTLAESIYTYGADYIFYIFLVDELDYTIDYNFFAPSKIILAKELPLNFESLKTKYNIIELNTCIKPSCFKYLFINNPTASHIHYFDPDIEIFTDFSYLDKNFNHGSILLTPHIIKPICPGNKEPNENLFLNYGLFNLGYIGLKNNSESVMRMLNWWEMRTLENGFIRIEKGVFVDQLWINFVPLFYPRDVKILFEPGYNMAPWNLHERVLTYNSEKIIVNDKFPLVFYHFSSYKFSDKLVMSIYNRYTFESNPDLVPLYDDYHSKLLKNNIVQLSEKECFYYKNRNKSGNNLFIKSIKRFTGIFK